MKQYAGQIFLIVAIALCSAVWLILGTGRGSPGEIHFSRDGVMLINTPGLKPGIWHLSYESPGAPALSAELVFDAKSMCATDGPFIPCEMTPGWHGKPVHVEGIEKGGRVRVRTLLERIETGELVRLYFYDPSRDQGPGGAQCTEKGLVALERGLPQTQTPLQDSIRLLLRGELSDDERAQGATTEFPLLGVELERADVENGTATLTFKDPQNKTGGGSCRVQILRHQIAETAKQFPGIESVRFMPEDVFQP